jgi:hypothetical protein
LWFGGQISPPVATVHTGGLLLVMIVNTPLTFVTA